MGKLIKYLLIAGAVILPSLLLAQTNSENIGAEFYSGIIMLAIMLFIGILYLAVLINILKSKFVSGTDKLIWLLVVFFIPILGILLYLFIGGKQKIKDDN